MHDGSEQTEDTSGFTRPRGALKQGDFTTAAEGGGVDEAGSRDGLRKQVGRKGEIWHHR